METVLPIKPDTKVFKFRSPSVNMPTYSNLQTIIMCLQLQLYETVVENGVTKEQPVKHSDNVVPCTSLAKLFVQKLRVCNEYYHTGWSYVSNNICYF